MGQEVVSIQVGGGGIRLGSTCWELWCTEHGLNPDGTKVDRVKEVSETFFRLSSKGSYVPRAVFCDLETSAIDELRTNGLYRDLFDVDAMVASDGNEDRRSYHHARSSKDANETVERSMETIRKLVEDCTSESCLSSSDRSSRAHRLFVQNN